MDETQNVEIGSGEDLSALSNNNAAAPPKVSFANLEPDEPEEIDQMTPPIIGTEKSVGIPMNYDDPDQRKRHMALVKMLLGYANSSFAKRGILSDYDLERESLKALSIETLETMLEDVKFAVGMSNSATFSIDMFKMGIYGIETAVTSSGFADLTGFTHAMLTTPNMNDYLEELALDMQEYTTVRPSLKIAFIGLQKGMQVNSLNQQKKQLVQSSNGEVSDRAKELGDDL